MSNEEKVYELVIKYIGDLKYKFMNIDDVSALIKTKLPSFTDSAINDLSIAVKRLLVDSDRLNFFKEGDYIQDEKFYFCTGNWLAIKDVYANPVQAKFKCRWYSWQDKEEINWSEV